MLTYNYQQTNHYKLNESEVQNMKQLTNYQRISNYLVKVFKAINSEYFNDELEVPTITIQSTVGAYGHVTVSKVWHAGDTATHELIKLCRTI